MTYRFETLQRSTVAILGSLLFTAMLVVASAPQVVIA